MYKAYWEVRANFCSDCLKIPEISALDSERLQECCSIFLIFACTQEFGEMFSAVIDVLESTSEKEIFVDMSKFVENREEVQKDSLRQTQALNNLHH